MLPLCSYNYNYHYELKTSCEHLLVIPTGIFVLLLNEIWGLCNDCEVLIKAANTL